MKKLKLEIGKRFGKWTIISDKTEKKNNLTHWECQCDCGVIQKVPLNNLMNGSSTQCFKCAREEAGAKRRKGHEGISGHMWSEIKSKAKRKDIPFSLRIEEAWERYIYQNGKCMFTGDKIKLSGYPYDKKKTTAKLTLIEPELGFSKDNVIWVHKDLEKLKSSMSLEKFLEIVYKIKFHSDVE